MRFFRNLPRIKENVMFNNHISTEKGKMNFTKIAITICLINIYFMNLLGFGQNIKYIFITLSQFITQVGIIYIIQKVIKKVTLLKIIFSLTSFSTIISISIFLTVVLKQCIYTSTRPICIFLMNNNLIISSIVSYYTTSSVCTISIISVFLIWNENKLPEKNIKYYDIIVFLCFLLMFNIIFLPLSYYLTMQKALFNF